MQCRNHSCKVQAAAPLDVLSKALGITYVEADAHAAQGLTQAPNAAAARERATQRAVMDFWMCQCSRPRTTAEAQVASKITKAGLDVSSCRFSATVMGKAALREMVTLAKATGAEFPDAWETSPPTSAFVFCVQSVPHTIDRLVVRRGKTDVDVLWHPNRAGFTGLIGINPGKPRYLTTSVNAAMRLQFELRNAGIHGEVVSVFEDPQHELVGNTWTTDGHMLTAVVSGIDDMVRMQRVLDCFPDLESSVRATSRAVAVGVVNSDNTHPWNSFRRSLICGLIDSRCVKMPPEATLLFEQTGSRPEDAAKIIDHFAGLGRLRLAADIKLVSEQRILFRERGTMVRETANEYQLTTTFGTSTIANFALRLKGLVMFRDREHEHEVYYSGLLYYGKHVVDVLISQAAMETPRTMQEELRTRVITSGHATTAAMVPSVIDTNAMKSKVLPALRSDAAYLPPTEGISRVGWAADRSVFHVPGLLLTMDGRTVIPTIFHPGVPTLRSFKGVESWSDTCPSTVHPACQSLIAMMLALVVRYYRRCALRPACIAQTSNSAAILEGLAEALGQTSIFELGHNNREHSSIEGVHGYPFVAAGFSKGQLLQASVPYMIMTSEGFRIEDELDSAQIEEGGRALQFALLRVVDWCLTTGADDFKEHASTDYNTSLMREGQWLMESVCKLQPWEISVQGMLGMEQLFAQIPACDVHKRITVLDGVTIVMDVQGLTWDRELVAREMQDLGAGFQIDGDKATAVASRLMPSLYRFYGGEPDVTSAVSP